MKYIGTAVILTLVLSVASQLYLIAEDSGNKAVEYANDINKALNCATKGIDIKVCSPDIFNTDFENDIYEFSEYLENISAQDQQFILNIGENLIFDIEGQKAFLRFEGINDSKAEFNFITLEPELTVESFSMAAGESRLLHFPNGETVPLKVEEFYVDFVIVVFENLATESDIITSLVVYDLESIKGHSVGITPLWFPCFFLLVLWVYKRYVNKNKPKKNKKKGKKKKK